MSKIQDTGFKMQDIKPEQTIECCIINVRFFVILAKAGNQRKDWIPCPPIKDFEGRQERNDKDTIRMGH